MNEKEYFYTVIEDQMREDGHGLLYDHFDDYNQALAKLYTILQAAAVSELPVHAGYIIRSDGIMTDGRVFDRRGEDQEDEE